MNSNHKQNTQLREQQWSKLITNVTEELTKKYYLAIIELALTKLGLELMIEVRMLANFY